MTKSQSSPIFIITRGSANVILTTESGKQVQVERLRCGDAFGYSDALQIMVSKKSSSHFTRDRNSSGKSKWPKIVTKWSVL